MTAAVVLTLNLNILFGAHTRRHHWAQEAILPFMIVKENISLKQYTTFKVGGSAKFFCVVKNEEEIIEAVKFAKEKKVPFFILGGGSNLLVSDEGYSGLVIKIENDGISYSDDLVIAAAGENWDHFVEETIKHGLSGLENLSAIPGTVGASAVQNIGAYGQEAGKIIESVRALDTKNSEFVCLLKADCNFSYRSSLFKEQKGRFIITSVSFKLEKKGKTDVSYRDLAEYFKGRNLSDGGPSAEEVRRAVIEIRKNKLPDWKVWGTAGSFFKNPIITVEQCNEIKKKYPDLPSFPESDGNVKISLGWVLDKICNARGLTLGGAHIFEKQALVVVAKPGSSASEVVELTNKIQSLVKEKIGLTIEAEVEWVN